MFTDCGDRNLYINYFVILSVIYVYAFIEKQSCAFIIYFQLYPFMLSQKSRLCSSFTVVVNHGFVSYPEIPNHRLVSVIEYKVPNCYTCLY